MLLLYTINNLFIPHKLRFGGKHRYLTEKELSERPAPDPWAGPWRPTRKPVVRLESPSAAPFARQPGARILRAALPRPATLPTQISLLTLPRPPLITLQSEDEFPDEVILLALL